MSVRKRSWRSKDGETREAWVVDYADQLGARHHKTFRRKKDADRYHATVALDVASGIHTPDSASITVAAAAELWLAGSEAAGLERTTLVSYREHVNLHIVPFIGRTKLSAVTVALVRALEDRLRAERSPSIAKRAIGSLGSILADAMERGLVAQNVVRSLRSRRRRGKEARAPQWQAPSRRRHSHPRRSPRRHRQASRPLAAGLADGDLRRPARFRVARTALGRYRPRAGRTSCQTAGRPLQLHRPPRVTGRRADDSVASYGSERPA
jgi:hypothetical protein